VKPVTTRINPVQAQHILRRTHTSTVREALLSPAGVLASIVLSLTIGYLAPATLLLTPFFLCWQIIVFSNERFRLPLRMPMDGGGLDYSTEREIRRGLPRLGLTWRSTRIGKAQGILCLGNARGHQSGQELWLSMGDALRHMMIMATTGGGKTETLYGLYLNALCWARGCCISDGKAQVDLAVATWSMARRFGREDDYYVLNFLTGGKDRLQDVVANVRGRAQSNTINPFSHASATFILQLMESLLPAGGGSDEGWKDKARAMMNALIYALSYKRARDGILLSQATIQHYLPLRRFAELCQEAQKDNWHQAGLRPLENYLSTLAGFDMALISKPSEWSAGVFDQHGFLIQQFSRMLGMFNDVYGHIFSLTGGDIDMQDVLHNDRILVVLIPSLELSNSEAATLGKLYLSDLRMNIAQALGSEVEGTAEQVSRVRKFDNRFPFLILADEVGYYFAEGLDKLAAQLRSLKFMLTLLGQDLQAMINRGGKEVHSVTANTGTKLYLKTEDTRDTLELIRAAAGKGYFSEVQTLERQEGMLGGYQDSDRLQVRERDNIELNELKRLAEGEGVLVFEDNVVRTSSVYIPDSEKFSTQPMQLNRFVPLSHPQLADLEKLDPTLARRRPASEVRARQIVERIQAWDGNPDSLSPGVLHDPVLSALALTAFDLDNRDDVHYNATQRGMLLFHTVSRAIRKSERKHRLMTAPKPIGLTRKQLEAAFPPEQTTDAYATAGDTPPGYQPQQTTTVMPPEPPMDDMQYQAEDIGYPEFGTFDDGFFPGD
jgi:intracellular multiplication protein IcmO